MGPTAQMPAAGGLLSGVLVVLTRPAERAAGLARRIDEAGGKVLVTPLIEIVYRVDPVTWEQIRRLRQYDALVVTSANAVRGVVAAVEQSGSSWADWSRGGLPVCYAVGSASGQAAQAAGLPTVVFPGVRTGRELAARLAAEFRGQNLHWFIPLGQLADAAVWDVLRQSGHRVTACVVYETRICTDAVRAWPDRFAACPRVVVTFASPSAVQAAATDLGWRQAGDVRVAVIGPTTAQACREAGIPVHAVAPESSDDGMFAAILAAAGGPEQTAERDRTDCITLESIEDNSGISVEDNSAKGGRDA